ncbi:MAG: hypothetical protein AB1724_16080 [Thermodesulfobacteriota bacterium]
MAENAFRITRREGLYATLLLLIIGGFLATSLKTQLNPDGILYAAYPRSAFFDRDILLVNEFNDMQLLPLSRHVSATGLEGNPVAIGTSLLMTPFYALAFLADHVAGLAGLRPGGDGYRGVYAYVFPVGSLFYGFLTALMLFSLASRYGGREHAVVSLLHVVLGTPFFFYLAIHYHVSHLCSAFGVTLFLYAFEMMSRDPDLPARRSSFFVLGAFSGIAILTRTQDGLFWVIPFCFLLFQLQSGLRFRRIVAQGLCFLAGAATAVSPQLVLWKVMHGRWIHAPEAANIDVYNLHLPQILTSSYHGLFVWTPVVMISLAGLILMARHDPRRGIALLLAVMLQLAVSASMRMWWQGASFGLRLLVNCTPIFFLGLTYAYARIRMAWIRWLGGLLVVWTILLGLNVVAGRIDLNRFYPLAELCRIQARLLVDPAGWQRMKEFAGLIRYPGGAAMVTAGVVLVVTILVRYGRRLPGAWRQRVFSTRGATGALATGIALSGLIGLLGVAAHDHKRLWQEDLKRIENGLNSYERFYIDYSYFIMNGEYLVATGRLSEAADEFSRANAVFAMPASFWRQAEILAAAGRQAEAWAVIDQALERWPDNQQLRRRVMGAREQWGK